MGLKLKVFWQLSLNTWPPYMMVADIKRGVKQGYPLSPLIFNLALDPIIEKLDETMQSVSLRDERVSILAFADDLILLGRFN